MARTDDAPCLLSLTTPQGPAAVCTARGQPGYQLAGIRLARLAGQQITASTNAPGPHALNRRWVEKNPPRLTAAPGTARLSADDQMLPGEFLLRDGTPAMIWPLLPTDAETVRDIFRRMSLKSWRRRFLIPVAELSDSMIRYLVDSVDGVHHVALVLTVLPPDGEERPVGTARLLQTRADPATADIAFAVADDWQGRGVGTALLAALMQRRPAAVRRLRTAVDAGNRASLALLAKTGHMSSGPAEQGVLDVTVHLTPGTAASPSPSQRPACRRLAGPGAVGAAPTPGRPRTP
jgi:RimJ/RimL family protein N-acetyltransferase